ncbi:hypothetical protein CALCODRAFT_512573 [Calocera cornea HHB12733]|uniref:Uncharacterized protein n=1 Tax=Calocera cornea HHB12733 TaxID=1353952 RepID=A0A165CXR6_9BASI|nr:hypothetical protein CALCODRAFT_512573 [Calocera cornea HHB12733]
MQDLQETGIKVAHGGCKLPPEEDCDPMEVMCTRCKDSKLMCFKERSSKIKACWHCYNAAKACSSAPKDRRAGRKVGPPKTRGRLQKAIDSIDKKIAKLEKQLKKAPE